MRQVTPPSGFSLLELLLAIALALIMAAAAVPMIASGIDDARAAAATNYLAGRMYLARMEAVKRNSYVGIRFEQRTNGHIFRVYADGNCNGIRTRDITNGIDRGITAGERLPDRFRDVVFGILPGVTPIDPGDILTAGGDPIHLGRSDILSFAPDGSATAGTVYICGHHPQFAIRVLGATGRIRTLKFDFQGSQWIDR